MKNNWSEKMLNGFLILKKIDPNFRKILNQYGLPEDRSMPNNYDTLVKIIIGQQISRSAAKSIYSKLSKNKLITVEKILKETVENLKKSGLSFKKIEYIKNIAAKIQGGGINLKDFNELTYDETHDILINLRGIGEWTINNYMLFSLQNVDAWPGGDLALQEAVKRMKDLEFRPNVNEMLLISENWKPYRGSAALILWHYYSKVRTKNDNR